MTVYYRVLRRTSRGVEVIAEIREGFVTGDAAELVRERLIHFGYPKVPLEEALRRFRAAASSYIGFEQLDSDDQSPAACFTLLPPAPQ